MYWNTPLWNAGCEDVAMYTTLYEPIVTAISGVFS